MCVAGGTQSDSGHAVCPVVAPEADGPGRCTNRGRRQVGREPEDPTCVHPSVPLWDPLWLKVTFSSFPQPLPSSPSLPLLFNFFPFARLSVQLGLGRSCPRPPLVVAGVGVGGIWKPRAMLGAAPSFPARGSASAAQPPELLLPPLLLPPLRAFPSRSPSCLLGPGSVPRWGGGHGGREGRRELAGGRAARKWDGDSGAPPGCCARTGDRARLCSPDDASSGTAAEAMRGAKRRRPEGLAGAGIRVPLSSWVRSTMCPGGGEDVREGLGCARSRGRRRRAVWRCCSPWEMGASVLFSLLLGRAGLSWAGKPGSPPVPEQGTPRWLFRGPGRAELSGGLPGIIRGLSVSLSPAGVARQEARMLFSGELVI